MSDQRLLSDAGALKALAKRLSRCEAVTRHDKGGEHEAWTLAHAFGDLEESFRNFLEELLPGLISGQLAGSEIQDLLLEIGEECRHILYHIRDPRFYQHLANERAPSGFVLTESETPWLVLPIMRTAWKV